MGNEAGVYGASTILYPNAVEHIANELNANLYILPSSVHEFIILPETDGNSLDELADMVQRINKDYVKEEEILSDQAYFYNKNQKKFIF